MNGSGGEGSPLHDVLRDSRDIRAFGSLAHAIRDGQVIALIGAGCSVRLGYPGWGDLLDELHDLSADSDTRQGARQGLRTYHDVLWRAEEYESLLTPERFRSVIARRFGPRSDPDQVLQDLVRLPFRHIITTNYDPSLEEAHRQVHGSPPRVLNWADREGVRGFMYSVMDRAYERNYVYLHGRYDRPDTIVLTDSDYALRYVKTEETSKKLFALFAMHPVLFIGFSLEDPDLMALLREVNAALEFREPRHFALVSVKEDGDRLADRARLRKKFGIDAVFYDTTRSYEGLAILMRGLVERCCADAVGVTEAEASHVGDEDREEDQAELEFAVSPAVITFEPEPGQEFSEEISFRPDPSDPHKGRFGGLARREGFELTAKVEPTGDDWFDVALAVRAEKPGLFARKKVLFHLHPTFPQEVVEVKAKGPAAALHLIAYGAFTVGAEIGDVRLELDLATLPDAPAAFVSR